MVKCLVAMPGPLGSSLRAVLNSPPGRSGDEGDKKGDPFPLPMPSSFRDGLLALAAGLKPGKMRTGGASSLLIGRSNKKEGVLKACALAWGGLQVLALNTSRGFTSTITMDVVRSPLKKRVLSCLLSDAESFVRGDGLSKDVVLRPEVPWRSRIADLSVGYTGEVVEKARWLTWAQVEPGLPPVGKGGALYAPDFCDGWVSEHLTNAALSRIPDELIKEDLPFATVRATQQEWNRIGREMLERGVACVMEPHEVARCNGEMILNGAFGVIKPNKWVGDPSCNRPVLRLIMDFRNTVHRMLPGSVSSLVGAAKWQGFCVGQDQVVLASGDDLVSAFYLFRLPKCWAKYFTFRKSIPRGELGLSGNPLEPVYIAAQVLPMGWGAAVTIMQHIHRNMALRNQALPMGREIHRERALPEVLSEDLSVYWNLYIDDLTILEMVSEKWFKDRSPGDLGVSQLQSSMEQAYKELGVPFSKEKASSREVRCEKLGALLDGESGRLGVTTARSLDFISLALFLMGEGRVPTKWRQIFLGKFVHLVQFRSMVEHSWERVARFNHAGPLTGKEITEWMLLCMVLYYTNLKAPVSGRVTCSDASPTGGGVCYSVGLTPLGRLGSLKERTKPEEGKPSIITFEWFAGIGGMSRALSRLHMGTHQAVVCECDQDCIDVLRALLPGCEVWKDICEVTEEDVRRFFDRWPDAQGVIQSGGSPCQGLSQLSSERQHFDDPRSNLFFQLVRVINLVKAEARARGMWHVGFVENVVCDPDDQKVFRDLTGWQQWLICSGALSHVRRPRFFWVSEDLDFQGIGLVEPGPGYEVVHIQGPKEPPEFWVSEGWSWMSGERPVSLPTFTRSIPRRRPPVKPAGIGHTPPDARSRWESDDFRYPPYTKKSEFCMEKNGHLRVASASEREILMGFSQGHTRLRKRKLSEDVRCSMVGNSFHTTVVAVLLRQCLLKHWPGVAEVTMETLHQEFVKELVASQREVYRGREKSSLVEEDETWLDGAAIWGGCLLLSEGSPDGDQAHPKDG